ncbi:hypothetical protein LSAT2_029747, partial [Lamellibrachia satsuma]
SKDKDPSQQPRNGKRRSTDCDVEVGENGVVSRELSVHGDDDDVSSEILRVETEAEKPLTTFARISKTFQVRIVNGHRMRVVGNDATVPVVSSMCVIRIGEIAGWLINGV